ncbi:hypothetical protein BC827DRAFT_1191440 [Russula dissimulans]|nr:hypothetical protein BC827DRAFT_1191440 [Russula dissimulans]
MGVILLTALPLIARVFTRQPCRILTDVRFPFWKVHRWVASVRDVLAFPLSRNVSPIMRMLTQRTGYPYCTTSRGKRAVTEIVQEIEITKWRSCSLANVGFHTGQGLLILFMFHIFIKEKNFFYGAIVRHCDVRLVVQ